MREGICNYFAVCFIKKGLFDTYKDRKKRRVQAVKEESGEKKRGNTFQMQSWKPRQPPRVVLQSDLRSTPSPNQEVLWPRSWKMSSFHQTDSQFLHELLLDI